MSVHTQIGGKSRKLVGSLRGQTTDTDFIFDSVRVTGIAAGTASTTLLADAQVPTGWVVHVVGYRITSSGSAWATGTDITIQDTNGSPVVFTTVTTANFPTSSAAVTDNGLGTQTKGQGLATGATAGKGLVLAQSGSYAGAATLTVEVDVLIKPNQALTYA